MEESSEKSENGYGKKSPWQWILIYLIVGAIVYGLVYYFVLAKKGGNSYNPTNTVSPTISEQTTTTAPASSKTKPVENSITLSADGYSPATLTIKAGTTVTWTNKSGTMATVNSDPHPTHTNYPPLNLGKFSDGETLTLRFDQPGTFGYHNHYDASQKGTVVVK